VLNSPQQREAPTNTLFFKQSHPEAIAPMLATPNGTMHVQITVVRVTATLLRYFCRTFEAMLLHHSANKKTSFLQSAFLVSGLVKVRSLF